MAEPGPLAPSCLRMATNFVSPLLDSSFRPCHYCVQNRFVFMVKVYGEKIRYFSLH